MRQQQYMMQLEQQNELSGFPVVFKEEIKDIGLKSQTNPLFQSKPRSYQSALKNRKRYSQQNPQYLFSNVEHNPRCRLQSYMHIEYPTRYPQFFMNTIDSESCSLQHFFSIYHPLDTDFIDSFRTLRDLQVVRLGQYKLYIGQMQNNACNGKGVLIMKNGIVYEGEFINNQRHGRGVYVHDQVGWYRGSFQYDLKNGHGIEVINHKSAYQGQFINGLRNHSGIFLNSDKMFYQGQWKLGIIHGSGMMQTTNSHYVGQFINWLKHGQGQQKFNNEDTYKGEYQNGKFNGYGTYAWKKKSAIYEGNFRKGKQHGKGKWSCGETKYSGNYYEGLKEGYGELYFPNGNFYKGNFVEDKREGYGEMFWNQGSFYKGEWRKGAQNGQGQLYISGEEITAGIFQDGKLVLTTPSIEKQLDSQYYPFQCQARPRKLSKIKKNINSKECKCIRRFQNFELRLERSKKRL